MDSERAIEIFQGIKEEVYQASGEGKNTGEGAAHIDEFLRSRGIEGEKIVPKLLEFVLIACLVMRATGTSVEQHTAAMLVMGMVWGIQIAEERQVEAFADELEEAPEAPAA